MTRTLLGIALVLFASLGPFVLFVIAAVVYVFLYTAYEVIFIVAMIEVFYGFGHPSFPLYTIFTIMALIGIEWAKPRLSVYNH